MLPVGIYFSLSVKIWPQVMVPPYSRTGYIISYYLYYVHQTSYHPPTYPQGRHPPGTLVGSLTSSTDANTDQISWTNTGSDQNPPTDFGIGPNIINIPWSRVNYFFPPPQIPLRRHNWSHTIGSSTKYLQQTSRFQRYPSGFKHLVH